MIDTVPCPAKKQSELSLEWDQLAQERHRQIVSGEDLSFQHVLVPTMLSLFEYADSETVLDIGSGTGDFTARLARVASTVIGVEPSHGSVEVARTTCRELRNVRFIEGSLEQSESELRRESVTAAAACMTLTAVPDLVGFAKALAGLLRNGAKFVAILPHPWFWPRYWRYETKPWFVYANETFIEAPFSISRCRTEVRTTHIHRPLEQYFRVFANAGFAVEALTEPVPSTEIQALYPEPWAFPRFLGLRWARAA